MLSKRDGIVAERGERVVENGVIRRDHNRTSRAVKSEEKTKRDKMHNSAVVGKLVHLHHVAQISGFVHSYIKTRV